MTHALQAADAVLALINAQPRTPTREEIAAIIQRTMQPVPPEQRLLRALLQPDFPMAQDPPASPPCSPAAHRAEWDALAAELSSVDAKLAAWAEEGLTPAREATEAEAHALIGELNDCAALISAEPARSLDDIRLRAEVLYWTLWSDAEGLAGPQADARLASGPTCDVSGKGAEALAALLRGIRDVTS